MTLTDTVSEDGAEETSSVVKPRTGVVTESTPSSPALYLNSSSLNYVSLFSFEEQQYVGCGEVLSQFE